MLEASPERIVERLTQLEAENRLLARKVRRLTGLGFASLLGVFVTLACGAAMLANPDLKPGEIIITDPGGSKVGISLKADPGGTAINMYDASGANMMNLSAGKTGFGLSFTDGQGNIHHFP